MNNKAEDEMVTVEGKDHSGKCILHEKGILQSIKQNECLSLNQTQLIDPGEELLNYVTPRRSGSVVDRRLSSIDEEARHVNANMKIGTMTKDRLTDESSKIIDPLMVINKPECKEVNNNLDQIQPQFKELSLNSPNDVMKIKKSDCIPSTKTFRCYVELTYKVNDRSEPELQNIVCEPIVDSSSPIPKMSTPDSDSSGHLGDVSKTISSLSGSPLTYIPPPRGHLTRVSNSTSSTSSLPNSGGFYKSTRHSTSYMNLNKTRYLNTKWRNPTLIYHILDVIDQTISQEINNYTEPLNIKDELAREDIPEESTLLSTRKRHTTEGIDETLSKRLKPSSIASTSYNELLGVGVFAKWQNRKYYFAHIVGFLNDGRIQVAFLDTTSRFVTRDQIIIELNLLIGHKVMVSEDSNSDQYFPGIVTAFTKEDNIYKYSVATNNGDFDVNVSQLYFTEFQAKFIKQGSVTETVPEVDTSALYPGCSGIKKKCTESASDNDTMESQVISELDTSHITGCDIETNDPQNLNSSVKLKNVQGKLPKRSNKNEDDLLGPLKFKGNWFKGMNFLITCSSPVLTALDEEVHTDSEAYQFSAIPFVYDRLVQQIKLGGGQVFEKFENVPPTQYSDTYLVTNRPCVTPKYLRCLAVGITVLCHEWVVNCTHKQKLVCLQELPAGWSLEKCRFISTFERKTCQPLSGLRIMVTQLTERFYKFWAMICSEVGAKVSKFSRFLDKTDVIIAENGFKDIRLEQAVAFGIPIVSASWITQSVIHGEVRPYDGHPFYNHLHEETEDF